MTYKNLIQQYSFSDRAYQILFVLSKKIKNFEDYLLNKNQDIDFSIETFQQTYNSSQSPERISKQVYFYENFFHLMEGVFCPRYETELIIEEAKKLNLKGKYIDICSGTGVIGISLLKINNNLEGTLLDISPKSIENIKINLEKHQIKAKIIHSDWLKHLNSESKYQVITANFPYVGYLDPIETQNEPPQALFAPKNGWEHYEKFIKWARNNSCWKTLILELSAFHEKQWNKTISLNQQFNIKIIKDMNNLLRVAVITRKQDQ